MGEIQRILGQLKEGFPKETDQRTLVNHTNLVNQAKKLAVYVGGVVVHKYMAEIKDRQSFMVAMADFIFLKKTWINPRFNANYCDNYHIFLW